MKKNQILPVLGAGGDGAAVGQQHPRVASPQASPNPQQHLAARRHTACHVSPRSHPVCPLLPCLGSDGHEQSPALGQSFLAQPTSQHNLHPGTPISARSPAWSISPGLVLAVRWPSSTQILLQSSPPRCRPPQLRRLWLPGFQTGFPMMGRLQALGCPPFCEEVISDRLCGATAGEG